MRADSVLTLQLPTSSVSRRPAGALSDFTPHPDAATVSRPAAFPPEETIARALVGPLRKLGLDFDATAADALAAELVACVRGPELDFRHLGEEAGRVTAHLPSQVWEALLAKADQPITQVLLHDAMGAVSDFALLGRGLRKLPALAHVSLPACERSIHMNLQPLRRADGPPASIELRWGGQAVVEHVAVPAGTTAWALGAASGPAARKARVTEFDERGMPLGEPCTLAGLVYRRKDGENAGLNLNNQAVYNEAAGDHAGKAVVCCDLGVQLALDRIAAHEANRAADADAKAAFSMAHFTSAEAIGARTSAQVRDLAVRIERGGAQALFDIAWFGQLLAGEFATLDPGERHWLFVLSSNHLMTVELHHKIAPEARDRFAVAFYDPNDTASLARSVFENLAQLAGKGLESWVPKERLDEYFGHFAQARLGAVVRHDPDGALPRADTGTLLRHVPPALRGAREFLHWAARQGLAEEVGAFLEAAGERHRAGAIDDAGLQFLAAGVATGMPALTAAMRYNHHDVAERWLRWLLEPPTRALPAQRIHRLLSLEEDGLGPLETAICLGSSECVAMYTRLVAAIPEDVLAAEHKLDLLRLHLPAHIGRPPALDEYLREIDAAQGLSDAAKTSLREHLANALQQGSTKISHDSAADMAIVPVGQAC